jgi:cytochrome b561
MFARDRHERFSHLTLALHWLLAAGIVAMLAIGFTMDDLPDGPAKTARVRLHVSIGLLVLGFGLLRLWWRLLNGLPRPAGDHRPWERALARATHWLLLAAPIYMPATGILLALSKGYAIGLFGLEFVAAAHAPGRGSPVQGLHALGGTLVALLVLLHVAGAVKHAAVDRDATLGRMLGRRLPGAG